MPINMKVDHMNIDEVSPSTHHNLCDTCSRNPDYLIIHRKSISRLAAVFLLGSFFIFVTGYFFGKKKLAEEFSSLVEQTNFSDQINFALTSLYDKNARQTKETEAPFVATITTPALQENKTIVQEASQEPLAKENASQKKFLAQLLGGTQKNVTEFTQRLAKHGIAIDVRKRFSKTTRGNKIVWYQAVTPSFENEGELMALVSKIKKLEKINDIQIIQIPT